MNTTLDAWLARHPFLAPLARLETTVRDCLPSLPPPVPVPDFEPYRADFEAGLALLRSPAVGPRLLEQAAPGFEALGTALLATGLPEPLGGRLAAFFEHLRSAGPPAPRVLASLAADTDGAAALPHPEAGRFVAWHALAHALAPTIEAFAVWRADRTWPSGSCPTCGAKPLLSVLARHADGRQRSLVCGLCATRWPVARLGCPHCASLDEDRLAILELEDEPELRLEVCDVCKGYLKTWAGQADREPPYFTDWATLQLDAMAAERGYLRLGASLYEP